MYLRGYCSGLASRRWLDLLEVLASALLCSIGAGHLNRLLVKSSSLLQLNLASNAIGLQGCSPARHVRWLFSAKFRSGVIQALACRGRRSQQDSASSAQVAPSLFGQEWAARQRCKAPLGGLAGMHLAHLAVGCRKFRVYGDGRGTGPRCCCSEHARGTRQQFFPILSAPGLRQPAPRRLQRRARVRAPGPWPQPTAGADGCRGIIFARRGRGAARADDAG